MDSGNWIRKLREERFLKPTELERLSRAIAEAAGNSDFYISHGSLADIEAGAFPASTSSSVSLAFCGFPTMIFCMCLE